MSTTNKKYLITGATGFIGSHLAKDLVEKGARIKCLVRRSSPEGFIKFLSGLGAELAREVVREFAATRVFDISKARRELGFVPTVRLQAGMQETVECYQTQRYLP